MPSPIKIAFVGKMCSGKTTLAQHVMQKFSNSTRMAFADKVKDIARDVFGMKEKDRALLQQIGTKMREIDDQVWIKCLINKAEENSKDKSSSVIVLDDARYVNEIMTLHKRGWHIVFLDISKDLQEKRLKKTYPTTYESHMKKRDHASETQMEQVPKSVYDLIIHVNEETQYSVILKFDTWIAHILGY